MVWNWAIPSDTACPSLLAQCNCSCLVYISTILLALIRYIVAAPEGNVPASVLTAQPAFGVHRGGTSDRSGGKGAKRGSSVILSDLSSDALRGIADQLSA